MPLQILNNVTFSFVNNRLQCELRFVDRVSITTNRYSEEIEEKEKKSIACLTSLSASASKANTFRISLMRASRTCYTPIPRRNASHVRRNFISREVRDTLSPTIVCPQSRIHILCRLLKALVDAINFLIGNSFVKDVLYHF